ncbi:MAG: hypothetical protein RBS89_01405 [Candidatus Delongbacteria bacterium]|jgi:spermidine synthase|nr:hypothetical protein [Candidatus Delongbacteria bacterium]
MHNRQTKIFIALAVILFFSGSYSLIYQIAWVRFLTLLLGSTTMGITTVVSTFMGGLAIGSWLSSKYLIGREKPLKVYALLELIISVTASLSPLSFNWAFASLPGILQKFGEADAGIFMLRIIFSAIIMLVPTICMGAALPVLGKYLQLHSRLAERRITIIYGLNTVGACMGCIASGYVLLPTIGLINTIYVTAGANALLPVAILLLRDNAGGASEKNKKQSMSEEYFVQGAALGPGARNIILAITAIVGFIGLASELVWTRMIVLTVGGSIYAFSTILAVYLFFYGVGATLGGYSLKYISVRFKEKAFGVSRSVFFILLMLIPIATTLAVPVVNFLPDYYIKYFDPEISSSAYGLFVNQLMPAVMLMSAATLMSGIFFTYGLYLMKQCTDEPAKNTSFFYAWNTFGSIAGSVTAAFFLIPYLGLDYTLRVTSTLLIAAGLLSAFVISGIKNRNAVIAASASLIIVWLIIPGIDRVSVTSGSGIYTTWYQNRPDLVKDGIGEYINKYMDQIYYRDGFSATIIAQKNRYTGELSISTNGKGDGSSYSDMQTQKLSAHFPAIFHPDPQKVCVIGYGTGTTVGSMAMHPGTEVDAIEIEPAVMEAAEFLNRFNNDPLSRDNVELFITDGRLHLQRNAGKYDIVISEPSNPWIAGVSDLFTVDFYKLASNALTDDGVFGQWIQIYNLNPEALKIALRSFRKVFPKTYLVVLTPENDLMMIGCKGSYIPDLDEIKRRISKPDIAADIAADPVNIKTAYELMSRLVMGPDQIKTFAGEGKINTDVLPVLSYIAPLSLFDSSTKTVNMKNISKFSSPNSSILKWDYSEEEINQLRETQIKYIRDNF